MKYFHYFVSFQGRLLGETRLSMAEFRLQEKISSYEDIKDLKEIIETNYLMTDVIIINYQLIRDEKY